MDQYKKQNLKRMIEIIGNDVLNIGIKLTYPVMGNASHSLKRRFEKSLDGKFSSEHATLVSEIFNLPLYTYAGYEMGEKALPFLGGIFGAAIGIAYWYGETAARARISKKESVNCASLIGKLGSLPFDYASSVNDRYESKDIGKKR